MGGSFSRSSSGSSSSERRLERYDVRAAEPARRHRRSDFSSPEALVDHLRPGDLIQEKGNFFYSHWAVYIGNKEIVHVTNRDGSSSSSSDGRSSSNSRSGSGKAHIVRVAMLEAFRGKNVRKNNHMDEFWPAKRWQDIVRTARDRVGTPWDYSIMGKNCEHFASLCRYGREISLQSLGLYDVMSGAVSVNEYVRCCGKAVREKCNTFCSWIKRKIVKDRSAISGPATPPLLAF